MLKILHRANTLGQFHNICFCGSCWVGGTHGTAMMELYLLILRIRSASLGVHSLGIRSRYSMSYTSTICMHDRLPSCSRTDFLGPQTLCVFCIDWVDGSEVLLKLILGLKNHPYNSSIYLIHIPLHIICIDFVSATRFRTYKHCMCAWLQC